MKKRILLAGQYSSNDMTSFLRANGPFTLPGLKEHCEVFGVPANDRWMEDFRVWMETDICYLHRPFGLYGMKVIHAAKAHGVPLWVDHDDDILAIPQNSPHYGMVEYEKAHPSVEMSIKEADVLTCSGKVMYEEIKSSYKRSDAIHITTGLDDRLLRFKKSHSQNKRIAWRGSKSHESDLKFYAEAINSLSEDYPDHEWHFFGIEPERCGIKIKKSLVWPELGIFDFYHSFTGLNAQIQFVVLEDNKFNRVKSNLAWLDGSLAGSAVLMPHFEENDINGIIKYPSSDLKNSFKTLLDHSDTKNASDNSWEYIKENLLQSHLNKLRLEIIRNL